MVWIDQGVLHKDMDTYRLQETYFDSCPWPLKSLLELEVNLESVFVLAQRKNDYPQAVNFELHPSRIHASRIDNSYMTLSHNHKLQHSQSAAKNRRIRSTLNSLHHRFTGKTFVPLDWCLTPFVGDFTLAKIKLFMVAKPWLRLPA